MVDWQIGNVRITKIVEEDNPVPGKFVLPDATPDKVREIPWLSPNFITPEGWLKMSIHALIIETQGKKIMVDTCLGNDKPRPNKAWAMRKGPFLDDLASAGHPRESIDYVICTHLHVDHVGWNTMLVNDKWVPTFPNARYLFARKEWEAWKEEGDSEHFGPVLADSVQPVIDAGLADLVEWDHKINDEIWLEPTPGHTPGHVSVRISSGGENAVITGDMTHHPCQLARPEWSCFADSDAKKAIQTRWDFYAGLAGKPTLVIGTHFSPPTAGHIVKDGDSYKLEC
ncbi:MAG: MBL fold metallo-hydrolase [Pseudomonadales bacterium]|nr:MBL fold metallo-hydrolase [Pseudomonadales bacterium]